LIRKQLNRFLTQVERPARYVGGEVGSIVKDKAEVSLRFAFCFPDTYEIGMSHLGMKILYGLLNSDTRIWCERVFTPWVDMQEKMREDNIPLYGLESFDPLTEFDIIGFSLQYELSYNNILNMLDLGGVPFRCENRKGLKNLIIAGGPCTCNPEPLADFVDAFFLGESEENLPRFCELYMEAKNKGWSKEDFLIGASHIPGVYVPALYDVSYKEDGQIESVLPLQGAPMPVPKAIVTDLDKSYFPNQFIVPFIDIVHDRAIIEVMRGCIRACRFCQAGYIYRPLREKSAGVLNVNAKELCQNTGYDEVSLSSLSTSDYSQLEPLLDHMLEWSVEERINLSLPSLRVDNFTEELVEKIKKVRKSGLTFAPEAGTQRLRDVINKNVREEEIMRTCKMAFENGYTSVKLYFMLGLPTETMEDVEGILQTAQRIVDLYYSLPTKPKGKGVNVGVSVATFVPKPFTPFEFEPQDSMETVIEKQSYLAKTVRSKKISLSWHNVNTSILEAVFARGDRRLGRVMEAAYAKGCFLDSWDEHFRYTLWMESMAECGLDPAFYAGRRRAYGEILPWDHLDYYVNKPFLIQENQLAHTGQVSPNCREKCLGCGAAKYAGGGGVCFEKR